MTHQELLRELTETYLKSLISEASGSLSSDFDSSAPFGELGIDSFCVLKIIRGLEADFGTLPKSLLFENFTVSDLAEYFVGRHEPILSEKFAVELRRAGSLNGGNGRHSGPPVVIEQPAPVRADIVTDRFSLNGGRPQRSPQELLRELTETYLKSLISEASGTLGSDFDSSAPFGELGIDSFCVLKIIRRLEADFGTLPKSLLFENFTVNDLADYFVSRHEQTLSAKFAAELQRTGTLHHGNGRPLKSHKPAEQPAPPAGRAVAGAFSPGSIRILEKDALAHPELGPIVQALFERHKIEGCVSRGTRKIAPNLFIGGERRGYFNYSRSRNIILVYAYTGPKDYLPLLLEEMQRYCAAKNFQLNIFTDDELESIGGIRFSSTPFGVLQRIADLSTFNLQGGAMRRLRYQVSKFQQAGECRTQEYRCGSNPETDGNVAEIIDRWCAARSMVNPLVHDVKKEILAGTLRPEHRLFLTYVGDVLWNVILITAMSSETGGYLMDLEFYPPDMPMGGLEFGVVRIIETLAAEGRNLLSLGGTYGCKLESSSNADPEVDRILDELRAQDIFNDAGNLQFKNKFRPHNQPIFLCRPAGSGNPDNVIDIIMMIADPEKMQTPDEENHNFGGKKPAAAKADRKLPEPGAKAPQVTQPQIAQPQIAQSEIAFQGDDRGRALSEFGFNPINIPGELVEFDLKTDSWAQLRMPSIDAQMKHLSAQLQHPVSVDDSLRAVFPFTHFILTASGQDAEHIFFKAWPKKGIVPQNLLFPSTIFHQIDQGFTGREMPHPSLFDPASPEPYKGNLDLTALQSELAQNRDTIALVCIEVGNNAAGGQPVSMQHLRNVKTLLAKYSVPLVLDATRVVENARLLIEREQEYAGKSVWTVVREMLSHADAVIGSLTKDFCVNKGGIIATSDARLFQRLQELVQEEGGGIDLIDRKMIGLSLQNRKQIEARVLRRIEGVRRVWQRLKERKVPVMQPAGGHCILIDVKQMPEFSGFASPVASFVAWMYQNTGIRAGAHSVGMQKQTAMNEMVRLAIPVGLKAEEIECIADRLVHLFSNKVNIPEIAAAGGKPQPLGSVHANYKLVKYHNVTESNAPKAESPQIAPPRAPVSSAKKPASRPAPVLPRPAEEAAPRNPVVGRNIAREGGGPQVAGNGKSRRTREVAVVGMAGRYPRAKNLRELWKNLAEGRDCIGEIPADRYERRLQHGSAEKYRGGFIDDVDKFDSLFFGIAPKDAEMLDPQERLFLEVAWEALEDAGYYPESLGEEESSRNIGVFVGAVWAMYQMLGVEEKHSGSKMAPNSFLWSVANRVSYWLNLSGPSLTLDTACSSSLTALYLACEAIRTGECSGAIVGGVNLDLHQAKLDINQQGGALSPDGVCRSFGKGANGYVAGEGVGALFLKPLDQAVKDGDNIYGVIKSAVVNHGGRTSGYMVPNPKAQAGLIAAALEKADVTAGSIGYIEAHGTGTELGDPIEVAGLSNAFSADQTENQSCAIGSVKSNIGHLEAAAGIVGVSKVLLQMRHRQLVPSLHSAELNEFIDFKNSPFYVVQRREEWKAREIDGARVPLRAGISSFGAGGANAHIILENYEPAEPANGSPDETLRLIFPLSARNDEQLREAAVRLAEFLEQEPADLRDIAYTLQAGRKSFDHRLAIVAETRAELRDKLASFIAGKKAADIVTGHVRNAETMTRLLNRREKEEFIRLLSQGRDPQKVAGLWAEGLLPDWQGFQSEGAGRRTSLPTYPFADKRHWAHDKSRTRRLLQPAAGVHPMVDSNESTFERQIFKKTFGERDFFIYDHVVADIPTLPGVAYLELARKAGEMAAGRKVQKIRNILWVSPIAVQNSLPKEVFIELKPSEAAVRFEVFSNDAEGKKTLHSQGTLVYATQKDAAAEPEYIDLESIRARCAKAGDSAGAYAAFRSFGLTLGPSFQVLQEVRRSGDEILGSLRLPKFREADLSSMVLHPSLVDGSLQAGVAALLNDKAGEMMVPYSIGEVEILHPLPSICFSYVTEAKDPKEKSQKSRVRKSNVLIVDETGKVLVKIVESTGVPLRELHKKSEPAAGADEFSRLCYSSEWEKAALSAEKAVPEGSRSLLVFDTEETLRLQKNGAVAAHIVLVRPGENFQDLGSRSYTINPQNRNDFTRLFDSLFEKQFPIEDLCFAWPLADAEIGGESLLKRSLERGVSSFLYVCQELIRRKVESKARLIYLYSVPPGVIQPHNDAVRGLVSTLRLEHPQLLCKTLEIGQDRCDRSEISELLRLEFQEQDAAAVCYRSGERCVRRLRAFDLEEAVSESGPPGVGVRENGAYLITGGMGGLGLVFAEFLAGEYQGRLVLTGRSKLSPEREAKLEMLRKSGAEVHYLTADISNFEDVRRLLRESKALVGEINGVIHAAGVLRDSLIRNKTTEEMNAVIAPKVFGTFHLDEATRTEPLDFFVTFSSLAAVTGNAGQCDYSFANHFMDSFAARRELLRAQGARLGRSISFNWSIWADGGMKLDEQTELYFRKTLGIKPLAAKTGLDAFLKGLATEKSQFVVLEGVQDKVEVAWGLKKKTPAPAAAVPSVSGLPSGEAGGELVEWLQRELSEIVVDFLKLDAGDMATDKILLDLGFESIGLTTFANAINEKYQLDITPILFFDYPTVSEIAKHLTVEKESEIRKAYRASAAGAGSVTPLAVERAAEAEVVATHQESTPGIKKGWDPAALDREAPSSGSGGSLSPEFRFSNMPIAIVGMSGVMPQSEDLEQFWEHLKNSKDLVTVIPSDRWRWQDYFGDPLKEVNKSNSKWGGFMNEVDKFDPLFFGISPREAQNMDPQQRIFLETVWKAVEDSGQKVSDLSGTRTGLFVGVATNDYINVMSGMQVALDGYSASGNSHSVLANRVSFLLNLRGPSAPIDTACSSSLIALHRAIESIHTGSCDMAIVGGVQVMLSPAAYISFGMAGMLSGDGKCKTFDKGANGYARGEGCGAVFLKTLSAAEADGNHIYAVIRATAENHGGRVTTLTAPNSAAQSALLVEAYEKAHIDPATVGYIECHGTGTSLGDPIEIQALGKAFAELYKKHNKAPAATPHCGLSSVKTNIGHLETAAGVASLIKVLLAMKHRQIPANIHFEEINPFINLKGTPFYIADKLTPWECAADEDGRPVPRRAGVSSFGFGGANAHIVLEEYVAPKRRLPAGAKAPQLIVLSAKNEDRLKTYMQSICSFVKKHDVELIDLAYTFQVGRDEMPERLALVASSPEDLKTKLEALLKGENPKDCRRANIRSREGKSQAVDAAGKEAAVKAAIEQNDLSTLSEQWTAGAKIDWRLLYGADLPKRISLPAYPFARDRYWIPGVAAKSAPVEKLTQQPDVFGSQRGADSGLQCLAPVWRPAYPENTNRKLPAEAAAILLAGGDQTQLQWVRKSWPNSQLLRLEPASSVDSIAKALTERTFDQLLWIAPDVIADGGEVPGDEQIVGQQQNGVLFVFRIIKALLQSGYANKNLQWTIITNRTQRVTEQDRIEPLHAGISGLAGSLAKEYPQWDLRLLDIDSLSAVSAVECWSLPWDKQGNALAHRRGEWFRQGLALMAGPLEGKPVYRQNGVYVVIGGAGGLGEVWTRYMMEHYQAKVVWIGRRNADAAIEAKIKALASLGHAPLYVSADATNADDLERARKIILQTYSAIHGVVHSAIVLQDQSLARMDEPVFRAGLSAKVDISVNMDKVFGGHELDFMLFFSSIVSFFKSPGQANYSAGCAFKDSFAQMLRRKRAYPVKIMNWGYWGNIGVVADESYNRIMTQMGIGSIEPEEGMAVLRTLVESATGQLALMKTLNANATAGLNLAEVLTCHPKTAGAILPPAFAGKASRKPLSELEGEAPTQEMTDLATEILASSLRSMGLLNNGVRRIAELRLEKTPAPYYERWLAAGISYLQEQKVVSSDLIFNREVRSLTDMWAEWEVKRSVWAKAPNLQAQIALFEACLRALPEILTAKRLATEVMFPNSSMHLVEGIYRGNVLADHFNEVLGETLVACIEQRLRADSECKIRILEIGAGTGGTTTKLLPLLQRFPIAEYCYTDVSRAFLMHAEKHFRPQLPALTTAIFDVTRPLAAQTIRADSFDFVIAANVLHATPDIRETVRNAKAALKNQGVLLLSEISTWSLFNHLTFGLLEGWWLHEDSAVRLPGSPGLSPENWREILDEEGFESVCFPAEPAHKLGQQIVAAVSDGWVRQRVVKNNVTQTSADAKQTEGGKREVSAAKRTGSSNGASHSTARTSEDQIRKIITEKLSEALQMDAAKIPGDAPFSELGVDSIIGINLVRTINEALDIDLPLKVLFENTSVEQLAELVAQLEKSDGPRIPPANRAEFDRLPLSYAQERVWFFDQLEPGSYRYNVPRAVTMHGALDTDRLERAFNAMIARHEVLRTLFPSQDGQARQLILDSLDFKLERIDLSASKTLEERDGRAMEICRTDATTPFDLARGPLLRCKVIRLAAEDHILMLNMHHIISDGWSFSVLIKDLDAILKSLDEGREPALAPLPIQYVDYSVWQRKRLEEEGLLAQQLAYWKDKLGGVQESLDLSADYDRPSVRNFAGGKHVVSIDAQLTGGLRSLAEHKGGTLFMSLLAAFKILLYRYTRQQDICVGTLIANRQYAETEGLIGMFANTLALRSQVDGEDTASALLSQVKATCLEAYEHQDTPFEKIVNMLRPQRSTATNPIFQVMLIFLNAEMGDLDQRYSRYPLQGDHSEFDLTYVFTETSEGLTWVIEYSKVLYKPRTIERMGRHFAALCQAIVARPTTRIDDLDYLSESEKRQVLTDFNSTDAEYPADKTVHELLAEQALIHPGRTAVIFGEQELTCQDLHNRSVDLALHLQSIGLKAEGIVGICMERSLDATVGILGTMQAGGVCLPADPDCPDDQLAYMLQDSRSAIVLTQEKYAGKISPLLTDGARLVVLDRQWPEIARSAAALRGRNVDLRGEANSRNACYALYVPSSASKPLGVVVEHRALVNRIDWMQRRYPLGQGDVVMQRTPFSMDSAVWELFWPLMAGASVALCAPGEHENISYLENLIHRSKVTILNFAPRTLRKFLENAGAGCPGVRRLFCSGHGLDKAVVDFYRASFPNASLHRLYAPSESAVDAAVCDCSPLNLPFVPIGSPVGNTQIYILDRQLQPQPIGIAGEMYVAGDGLARGYLNLPDLTREKFVANPFRPGTLMYKTGEPARWLDDGSIQYLGAETESETSGPVLNGGYVLEKVSWREESFDDSYEKVTF